MNKTEIWCKTVRGAILLVLFGVSVYLCRRFQKVPLVSTKGESYQEAVVTSISKDNLKEDGKRYGDQTVKVRITSGVLKGQEIEATSPSGNLIGADCTVGMKVIAIVSIFGDNNVVTVYSQDRSKGIYVL